MRKDHQLTGVKNKKDIKKQRRTLQVWYKTDARLFLLIDF